MRPLRLLFVCAEYAPLAKVGGLADMTAGLARYLAARGHDVRIVLPHYGGGKASVIAGARALQGELELGSERTPMRVWQDESPGPGPVVYRLWCPALYAEPSVYVGGEADGPRFIALSAAASELPGHLDWAPDIVHCHDWQAALVPVLLKSARQRASATAAKSLLTLHNLGYQGVVRRALLEQAGLGALEGLAAPAVTATDSGSINLLACGIRQADRLSTVSPTYAREIQTEAFGMGLHGLLAERSGKLSGILNGVDYSEWDPSIDTRIAARYSTEDPAGKQRNKAALCQALALDGPGAAPVIGLVSRLVTHKGIDLILEALPEVLGARSCSCVMLGDGEERLVEGIEQLTARFPRRLVFARGHDETLAHRILAGSDIFLMPSIYEPCGLTQLYALRYGTIPVVRATGGLADSIEHFDPRTQRGTGCVFEHANADGLKWGLSQALDWFDDADTWNRLRQNAMAADFSWDRQGALYEALYDSML